MNQYLLEKEIKDDFIKNIFYYEETDSTNTRAKEYIGVGNSIFITDYQSKGRGRFNRSWDAPRGKDLMFSILITEIKDINKASSLTVIAGLSVLQAINSTYKLKLKLKWPNDIIYKGKKLCGILAESKNAGKEGLIIGIGINCNNLMFTKDLIDKGTSIALITGEEVNRVELLKKVLRNFNKNFIIFRDKGIGFFQNSLRENSLELGRYIYITKKSEIVKAKALDINENGTLLIQHKDGALEDLLSGEINIEGVYGYNNTINIISSNIIENKS
ncbi:MAG TPA: biotin--[acetyl-CoA-carboxylase] ligase [Clostridiaceae bacterium]